MFYSDYDHDDQDAQTDSDYGYDYYDNQVAQSDIAGID
jgi:hypothetical protein